MTPLSRPARLSIEQRAEIQASQESVRALARRLGINPKSVQRWRRRDSAARRAPRGRAGGSTVLSAEEEAIIIAFRQTAQLALDDCLYALQPTIPQLRRSTLHRCLQRNGLSSLRSSAFPPDRRSARNVAAGLGQVALVVSPAPTEEGMFYLFGGADRLTRFAFAHVYASDRAEDAVDFLSRLSAALPYRLDAVLTDYAAAFAWTPEDDPTHQVCSPHPFAAACDAAHIRHILTPRAPGVPAATRIQHFKYPSRRELQDRLTDFLIAINYGQRLKTLGGLTPFDRITRLWRDAPALFRCAPSRMRPATLNE